MKIFQYQDNSLPLGSGKWFPVIIAEIAAKGILEADKILADKILADLFYIDVVKCSDIGSAILKDFTFDLLPFNGKNHF